MLHLINKFRLFLIAIIFLLLITLNLKSVFLPTDVLNNLPLFSLQGWEKPQNSLLADPVFQFEPWRIYAKEKLKQGEFPFWNELNGKGAPFFANPQTAVLFPLNFFYYILSVNKSLLLIAILKLFLLSWFSYLYFRSLKCREAISLVGALCAISVAFPLVWLQWPHTNVFIFFPLMLFLTEKLKTERTVRHRYYLGIFFGYLFATLGGHPETLFHLTAIHCIYSYFRLRDSITFSAILLFIVLGILAASFQLVPLMEYLLNSYAFSTRISQQHISLLPIQSFIVNLVPFIIGAPHQEFYKPITPSTNFQEVVGGYVGLIIVSIALFGRMKLKNQLVRLWLILIIGMFLVAYQIWPFSLLNNIPIFSSMLNERLIGLAGFGILSVFVLTLENYKFNKQKVTKAKKRITNIIIFALLLSLGLLFVITKKYLHFVDIRIYEFIQFLVKHILLVTLTSIIGLISFYFFSSKRKFALIVLFIAIFLQTGFFFLFYNPFTSVSKYYPENEIISFMQKLPPGVFLNIGTPNLPAEINIPYHISVAANNDALEIKNYRNYFDTLFPVKNYWRNVDEVSLGNLQKLGVAYVLSDYDIRLQEYPIQRDYGTVLSKITNNDPLKFHITPDKDQIKAIRMLAVTFNRNNSCVLHFVIYDHKVKIQDTSYPCQEFRNYQYFTFEVIPELERDQTYTVVFSSDGSILDSISFAGNKYSVPFYELLYTPLSSNKDFSYQLLLKKKNMYLFKVPDSTDIEFNARYSIIDKQSTKLRLKTNSDKQADMLIKIPYYPGWEARIDGIKADIKQDNAFIRFVVPSGEHIASVSYIPYSFFLGLVISVLVFLIVGIYILKNELGMNWWESKKKRYSLFVKRVKSGIAWWEHVALCVVGICVGASTYYLLIKDLHVSYMMPQTDAINWLTVHHYPKQQDYFYYYSSFLYVTLFTIFLWFTWIWIRLKKYI